MLTLTGSWRSPFGAEGPSEALSVQLLEHAATCTGGAYDHGACWAALATLLLFKGSTLAKDGSAEQRSTQQGRANSSPTEQPLGTIDALLVALDAAVGSETLVSGWLASTVLRRIGRLMTTDDH